MDEIEKAALRTRNSMRRGRTNGHGTAAVGPPGTNGGNERSKDRHKRSTCTAPRHPVRRRPPWRRGQDRGTGDTGARSAKRDETNKLVEHHNLEVYSRHWRTRSICTFLSPAFSTPGPYSATVAIVRARHRGASDFGTSRRGRQFPARLHFHSWWSRDSERGKSGPCIEQKGPPTCKPKDGHDSRGRNYKAETQLPTSRFVSFRFVGFDAGRPLLSGT
jgi:hypothetical protein